MLEKSIAEKLGLTQDATPEVIAKTLGVYRIVENKEEWTKLWKTKLADEFSKTNELTKKVTDLESAAKTSKETNDKLKGNLTKSLEYIWKANKIDGTLPIDKINLESIDYTNVDKSLAKVATDNGIKIAADKTDLKNATSTNFKDNLRIHNNVVI